MDAAKEQYSGFDAAHPAFGRLSANLTRDVAVMGVATEYCVLQTVKNLLEAEHRVTVLKDSLAYVDKQGHMEALAHMEKLGVKIK